MRYGRGSTPPEAPTSSSNILAGGGRLAERRDIKRVRCHIDHGRRRNSPVAVHVVAVHTHALRVGDVGRIEWCSELAFGEFGAAVDVEDVGRVAHGEHVEPVAHDERGNVDLFVDGKIAKSSSAQARSRHSRSFRTCSSPGACCRRRRSRYRQPGRKMPGRGKAPQATRAHSRTMEKSWRPAPTHGDTNRHIRMHGPRPASSSNIAPILRAWLPPGIARAADGEVPQSAVGAGTRIGGAAGLVEACGGGIIETAADPVAE